MPHTINGKHFNLVPGTLYNFKHPVYKNKVLRGIFVKHKYDWVLAQSCVFDSVDSLPRITLRSNRLTIWPSTEPMLAKQYARGLCDYIPEDCAGIIERLLVGNRIVGKGPDRYAERIVA